jgi:uncharacterized repeat protein (TIGR01451 family)
MSRRSNLNPPPARARWLAVVVAALAGFLVAPAASAHAGRAEHLVHLTTAKAADQATVVPGGRDGYTITITNPNDDAVTLTSITDTLPAGFAYVAGSTSGVTTEDPWTSGDRLCWFGSFAVAGDGGSVSLHFEVDAALDPGTYYNWAGGSAHGTRVDGTGPTAPVVVQEAGADLALTQFDTPDPGTKGLNVSYQFTATNLGPADATDVQFVDTVPDQTTLFEVIPGQGTCTPGTGTVSCAFGTIAAGASATVNVVVTTPSDLEADTVTNAGSVSAAEPDPDPGNNASSERTTVQAPTGDEVSGWLDGGRLATGRVATPRNPQATVVDFPEGLTGAATISEEEGTSEDCPTPFTCFGQRVEITSPDAVGPRLKFSFLFDASIVPPYVGLDDVQMFHDGVLVGSCDDGADPCVLKKVLLPCGDLKVLVLTTRNGTWRGGS